MTVTFDEDDWSELTPADKKALKRLSLTTLDFDPLAKTSGVGQQSMDSLVAKGITEEGPRGIHGREFRITDKGWLAVEWLNGRRRRSYP